MQVASEKARRRAATSARRLARREAAKERWAMQKLRERIAEELRRRDDAIGKDDDDGMGGETQSK